MKPSRVVILTGNHLCHNPRVVKEAAALAHAGWDVEVLGAWTDASLKARDIALGAALPFRFTPVIDLGAAGLPAKLTVLLLRLRGKIAQLLYRFGGVPSRWQFGSAVGALSNAARGRTADLFIAHSEAALPVAAYLSRRGERVCVDMEDWFSEDLLPDQRRLRPVRFLGELEGRLLRGGSSATCPSQAMSAALARAYGCRPPAVIYNAFPWSDRQTIDGAVKDRRDRGIPSIHWYSQTIGPGRGLEDLFSALHHVGTAAEVHLRGRPAAGFEGWLDSLIPAAWKPRVFVHGLVSNAELLSRIAEHDIGFAGEMPFCRSRDLTITNKILHYLLGGLAVVASDTLGQREVAAQAPGAVLLFPSGDSAALAAHLRALLLSSAELGRAKSSALRAAEGVFCWERQERALVENARRAAAGGSVTAIEVG